MCLMGKLDEKRLSVCVCAKLRLRAKITYNIRIIINALIIVVPPHNEPPMGHNKYVSYFGIAFICSGLVGHEHITIFRFAATFRLR